jgi:hypothetical protein
MKWYQVTQLYLLHNHNVKFIVNTVVLHCSTKCIGVFHSNGMSHIKPAVTKRNNCCQTSTFHPNTVLYIWLDSHNKQRLFAWMASTGWSWNCRRLSLCKPISGVKSQATDERSSSWNVLLTPRRAFSYCHHINQKIRQIKHGSSTEPNCYMFRHRAAILRESSRTNEDKSNTLNFAGTIKILKLWNT